MHPPFAIERAEAVVRHMRSLGGRPTDYTVSVTTAEGFELLRWFRAEAEAYPTSMNLELFDQDVKRAYESGNPFEVLQNFQILGLSISRMN